MKEALQNHLFAKIERTVKYHETLKQKSMDPQIIMDPNKYKVIAKELRSLEPVVSTHAVWLKTRQELKDTQELLKDPSTTGEMKELALEEEIRLLQDSEDLEKKLQILLLPKDPMDEKNIIVELRAGAGGEEAALFVSNLQRMYTRFAEKEGWKVEVLSSSETGLGGYKELSFSIEGESVYSMLKFESGVHRVQRVPETESSGRIHTSTITVAVLPEMEEVEFEINPSEVRIDTFCSSGPGGQSVNTTYSAVRLTHVPTGTVVSCQDEKSQIKNKEKAFKVLRARLAEVERNKQMEAYAQKRSSQVGTGDRSEKIRTYNFPQGRLTDHRIGLTVHNLPDIMEGNIRSVIQSLIENDLQTRLEESLQAD